VAAKVTATGLSPIWKVDALPCYMSTPVLVGDRLYGLSHRKRGEVFCISAKNGQRIWSSDGRGGENASFVATNKDLLILTTDSKLFVQPLTGDKFAPVATYTVASTPTWAHLSVAGNRMYVKDRTTLRVFSLGD
jgi:outer membrane protein assembly factor BamB